MVFCEILISSAPNLKKISLRTRPMKGFQRQYFNDLKKSMAEKNVCLVIETSDTIHDREIRFVLQWLLDSYVSNSRCFCLVLGEKFGFCSNWQDSSNRWLGWAFRAKNTSRLKSVLYCFLAKTTCWVKIGTVQFISLHIAIYILVSFLRKHF